MVKIRLKRIGHIHNAFFRIVVADSHYSRNGRFIEEIGYYNPYKDPAEIKVDAEACKKWIANGAKPTETCGKLLKAAGAI